MKCQYQTLANPGDKPVPAEHSAEQQRGIHGNTRKVRAFTIGLLTNANLTYVNSNLGVSLELQYMYSELLRIRTYYHEEKVTVKLNSNDDVNLTRLNITTGLSYYF